MMNAKENQKVDLRLQGAQVHLNYRYNNYRDGWKNKIYDRPRSAINNSSLRNKFTETHRRPFSAGTKPQSPRFFQFLRHSNKSNLNNFDWNHYHKKRRISFPTTGFNNTKQLPPTPSQCVISDDISERGSEDSLVSLGSRIKAKARTKYMRYRQYSNIATKHPTFEENPRFMTSDYNIKVNIFNYNRKITMEEEPHSDDSLNGSGCKEEQPLLYTDNTAALHTLPNSIATNNRNNIDKNTINESNRPLQDDIVAGRVSFGQHQPFNDLKNPESFSKKNYLNLQQLSLVEEESIIELDSLSSSESAEFIASEKSHENEVEKASSDASVEKEDQTRKLLNSRKESGTFILETSDFTKLWKNNEILEVTNKPITQYQCDNSQHCAIIMDKTDSKHPQSEIERQQISDFSKQFSPTFSSTIINHGKSKPFETYSSEKFNSLFESPRNRYTLPDPSSLPSELTPALPLQDLEAERGLSLDCISLGNNTELQTAINYKKQCSWNMSCKDVDDTRYSIGKAETSQVTKNDEIIKEELNHIERSVNYNSEESYPTYSNNDLTKAYTTRALDDYKKEIDSIDNLHQLTLKDLKLSSVSSTSSGVNTQRADTKGSNMDLPTSKNFSGNFSAGVRRLDVCNIPTEELIQNYFDAKEDNGSKKNRFNYKNVPRKKSAGRKLNVSDAEVKNINVSTNNLAKARKTCYSAPNLKCIEAKTNYRMQPLSARIECVQNDIDIESWVSTQIITPRVEAHFDTNKSIPNPSDCIKDLNVNIENVLDNKTNETVTDTNHTECDSKNTSNVTDNVNVKVKELSESSTVLDIYSMLKEIERYGDKPVNNDQGDTAVQRDAQREEHTTPKDNFQEIFTFLEKVEDSANEALSAVSPSAPITVPKLEGLLRLSHPELAQRVITAALQLEERSCCITLLQESLATHKEQTLARVTTLEKQSSKNITKVKQDCEEAIKRHQGFIDQLINDKKTLNHRVEQLVDERRQLDEKARRQARTLEERFKVELQTQHDKMAAAQQLARQRWVKQKAEKIKELTVKGLEGELRDMADRQQREVTSMRLLHAEEVGRLQAQHEEQLRQLRDTLQHENESALIKERQICSTRLEKQILEIELTYQEQRTRLLTEMRAENEKAASLASQKDTQARQEIEKIRTEQEKELSERHAQLEAEMNKQKMQITEELEKQREKLEDEFAEYKRTVEAEHQVLLRKRIHEVTLQHKLERDREIEKAIDSMELEAQKGRKELQDALRRNKEQYESELRDVAETERAAQQRHRDTQARARLAEDKCGNLEITISQLESKLRIAEENIVQCQQRLLDMQKLTEAKWRSKYDDMRAQADHMKSSHEEQMHQLYAKVKVAVARKDTAITALTRDNSKALEKVVLLEQRLQQQRKDFLRQK